MLSEAPGVGPDLGGCWADWLKAAERRSSLCSGSVASKKIVQRDDGHTTVRGQRVKREIAERKGGGQGRGRVTAAGGHSLPSKAARETFPGRQALVSLAPNPQ